MSACDIECGGRCCAVFPYTSTPEELRKRWQHWPSTSLVCRDDLYIADMLVPLDPDAAYHRMRALDLFPEGEHNPDDWSPGLVATDPNVVQLYTCKYWDEKSGLCGAYDERPEMCKAYPYDRKCLHCGCTAE